MASLKDQVRAASFRGIAFTVVSADTDGLARRVETHVFPFRDQPYSEDLGRQHRTFSFEAFVPWVDTRLPGPGGLVTGRESLRQACQTAGPGPLVHPFWGEVEAVCQKAEARESTSHVGLTFFDLVFVEAGENLFPEIVPVSAAAHEQAALAARVTLQQSFLERFLAAVPQWVTDASVSRVGDLSSALDAAQAVVPGGFDLAAFHQLLGGLQGSAAQLVADPPSLASTISATIRSLAGLSTDPLSALRMLESFASAFGATFASITAPSGSSRAAEGARQSALLRLARGAAVVEASVSALGVPLASYNEAAALRERLVTLFDGELDATGETGDDAALAALEAVRRESLRDLHERGGALARVRSLTLGTTTPAVVLAHRLYGDADRGDEIVARNRIRHPMFLPAAVPLEVLSA